MRVPETEQKHNGYFRGDFYFEARVPVPVKGPTCWHPKSEYYVQETPDSIRVMLKRDLYYHNDVWVYEDPEAGAQWEEYTAKTRALSEHIEKEIRAKAEELGLTGAFDGQGIYVHNKKKRVGLEIDYSKEKQFEKELMDEFVASKRAAGLFLQGEDFKLHWFASDSGHGDRLRRWEQEHKSKFPDEFIVVDKVEGKYNNAYHGLCRCGLFYDPGFKESVMACFSHKDYANKYPGLTVIYWSALEGEWVELK